MRFFPQGIYHKELEDETGIDPVKGYVMPMYRTVLSRLLDDPDRKDIFKVIDDETFELIAHK